MLCDVNDIRNLTFQQLMGASALLAVPFALVAFAWRRRDARRAGRPGGAAAWLGPDALCALGALFFAFPAVKIVLAVGPDIVRTFCAQGNLDLVLPPGQYVPAVPRHDWSPRIWTSILENLGWATFGGVLWWMGTTRDAWRGPTTASLATALRPLLPRMPWREATAMRRAAAFFPILVAINLGLLLLTDNTRINSSNDADVFRQMTLYSGLLLALAAGLGEEILYRAILQGGLARLFGAHRALAPGATPRHHASRWLGRPVTTRNLVALAVAILLQAIVFAYAHAGYADHQALLFAAIFALGMGLAVELVGLWPAIVLHALIDFAKFSVDAAPGQPAFVLFSNLVAFGVLTAAAYEIVRFARRKATPSS